MKKPFPELLSNHSLTGSVVWKSPRTHHGFALIVTLILMVLLGILASGMLSLSSITLRNSGHGRDLALAQANARMALALAIGELQRKAGPDTRITATADVVAGGLGSSADLPRPVTGVWRSWEGEDHSSSGMPIIPDYNSKREDFDASGGGAGRFLGWLISGGGAADGVNSPPALEVTDHSIPLLSAGTLGDEGMGEVHVVPTLVGNDGKYAWWIVGENTKALIKEPMGEPENAWEWSKRLASSSRAGAEILGFNDPAELAKLVSRSSMDLAATGSDDADDISKEHFHDITAYSRGLLTNTATGGWRRDMSLLSENWESVPNTGLPLFTLEPGKETSAGKTKADGGGLIYPWANTTACSSWDALFNFAGLYKKLRGGGSPSGIYYDTKRNGADLAENIPVHLLAARITWVLGYHATPTANPDVMDARLIVRPMVTMWNPYNTAIQVNENYSVLYYARRPTGFVELPVDLRFTVGNETSKLLNLSQILIGAYGSDNQKVTIETNSPDSSKIWKPGESRIYSMGGDSLTVYNGEAGNNIKLEPGLRIDSGYSVRLIKKRNTFFQGNKDDGFQAKLILNPNQNNTGVVRLDSSASDSAFQKTVYNSTLKGSEVAATWNQQVITNDDETLKSAASHNSPFLAVSWALRMANTNEANPDPDNVSVDTKGIFETNPLIIGSKGGSDSSDYPFEWHYLPVNDWSDTDLPQSDGQYSGDGDDEAGYIGTGFRPDDGLARLCLYELPVKPLQSLGELQHFQISYPNSSPPFAQNPIGNSHAYSQIAPDAVTDGDSDEGSIVRYDHSYVANHLLFDDWFVSSIAPEASAWTADNPDARSLAEVYMDFRTQVQPLPNAAYLPANALTETAAEEAAGNLEDGVMAWRNIASEIEVDGMFNINSTSVEAWKAILGNALNGKVAELEVTEEAWEVTETEADGQPVSRTTIAGYSNSSGNFANAVATHKRFSEDDLDLIATAIVGQIKERGPFLSLSEFVNRRLTTDAELAKAGVIEAALNELVESVGSGPYSDITGAYGDAYIINERAFPEAAEGNVVYGYPGWIRQADILRPIAPILTARDDTFTIRAFGESNGVRAWCEAVVQRRAEYVDAADSAGTLPGDSTLTSEANKLLGRRFAIVAFRWLSQDEV